MELIVPVGMAENSTDEKNQIIAVIAAAIAAAEADKPNVIGGYIVRSIRKARVSNWKRVY